MQSPYSKSDSLRVHHAKTRHTTPSFCMIKTQHKNISHAYNELVAEAHLGTPSKVGSEELFTECSKKKPPIKQED